MKEDTTYIPGVQWAKFKGEYPSYLMFNYYGGPEEVLVRENFRIYDSNSFVTLWVTIMQLEAALFPGGPALGEKQLLKALDAINVFHDHNREEGSSILEFWPQKFNETTGIWVTNPTNFGYTVADEKVLSDVLVWLLNDLDLKNQSELLQKYTDSM